MVNNNQEQMKAFQNSVAMTVTLISFGMLFATLFLGYFLARYNAPVWPPVELQDLPKFLPLASTFVIALSSLAYYMFEKVEQGKGKFWFLTFGLGIIFLVLQWILWGELKVRGIYVDNGHFPSMVYAFTWIHAVHILMGLATLLWLGRFVFKKNKKHLLTQQKIINVGKFWHFLGIVWFLIYLMMFVL